MNEQGIQKKITKHLEQQGFVTMKTMVMNRAGIPDILACQPPFGRFWAIEVKTEIGKLSKLQAWWLRKLNGVGAAAFVAYGWDDYLVQYKKLTVGK